MEGPPLGPGGEDITWPDQVAPRGRKASSTRKIKPQTSNLLWGGVWTPSYHRPFKLWFEFEVHLDQFFARQGWGQRSKTLLTFLDELTETGV